MGEGLKLYQRTMNDIPDNPFFADAEVTQLAEHPDSEESREPLNFREVTTSPAEEYSLREGRTEEFPQWIEAYLLQEENIGFATVTEKGIVIRSKRLVGVGKTGETRTYWSDFSLLCAEAGSRGEPRKIVYVFNTICTDYIHALDPKTRKYIETIPAVDKPAFFDQEAVAKEAAKYKRALHRNLDRIREIHQSDSLHELELARKNVSESQRLVATMELAEADQPQPESQTDSVHHRITQATGEILRGQQQFNETSEHRDRAIERRQVAPEPAPTTHYDPYNK